MRLSRIAIIFQSASICTTSLAARHMSHINEAYKVFNCDIELEQEEYSRIYHEKILDSATIWTLSGELNDLVGNTRDTRNVQFYDRDNGDYEYILLSTKSHRSYVGNDLNKIEYILVIDRQGRACAMMMRKTVKPFGDRDGSATRRFYSLCEVGSKYLT